MGFTDHFIHRPVATTLISVGMLLFGILGYATMPTSDMPSVDFPTIQVNAGMPGASPETMAATIATPLEGAFADISGLASMTSTNGTGQTSITLQFDLDRKIDGAAQDVQAAISKAVLPQGLPNPPTFTKVNPSDQPILYIAMRSDTLPLSTVNRYADLYVGKRISTIKGISQVVIYGEQKYAVRIHLDPKLMTARNIGFDDVRTAVVRENSNRPTGSLDGQYKSQSINAEGQIMEARDYRPIIVAYRGGRPVRLEELGTVVDSVYLNKMGAWWNDQKAIVLAVKRQPGANTIEAVDAVHRMLPDIEKELPASIKLEIMYDQSESIRESVTDVKITLLLAVILVILVVALFLRNITATVVTSLAVPMSLIPTFAVMKALGFSLDNLSLMALTLSVGFVVDDAIVMLENVVRHMEMGKSPVQAALDGAREIGFTIISMTVSLAVVFVPIVFMSGMVGRILSEFAVTITVAILVSGFISLTLTPMMASRFLRSVKGLAAGHGEGSSGGQGQSSRQGLFLRIYAWSLRMALRHRFVTLLCFFATLGITAYMFVTIPKGFIPSEDRGMISGISIAAEGISYEDMSRHMLAVSGIVGANPNVAGVMPVVGFEGSMNTGFLFIKLKPKEKRKDTPEQVMAQLVPRVAQVPGLMTFFQNPPPIQVSTTSSNAAYQFVLQGTDTEDLYRASGTLLRKMQALPQIMDVSSDLMISTPQLRIRIDRDKAATLGVSAEEIEDTLNSAFASRIISTIYAATDQNYVIMELDPQYRRYGDDLFLIHVRSRGQEGALVPLEVVAQYENVLGPLQVNHIGQLPGVTISFNTRPGVPLSEATGGVEKLARDTLPPGVTGNFSGTAREFQKSMTSLVLILLVALGVIYLILGILYESFVHPVTILAGLPSAGLGALLTLHLFHAELQVYAFVGMIMLIGIVKKNAIMMIDFALEAQRNRGMKPREAIYQGSLLRFRPIMMTTIAAFAGILPIAVGFGAGGAARQPLGLAVCGGLVLSQLITLLITPVIYTYLDEISSRLKGSTR